MKISSVLVNEPSEINFGTTEPALSLYISRLYLLCGLPNTVDLSIGGDSLVVFLIEMCKEAFDAIQGHTADFTGTTNLTAEQALMNLGKLARKHITGHTLYNTLNDLEAELQVNSAGAAVGTDTYGYAAALCQLWFVIGGDLKNYIGEWNTTTYKSEDEALGGLFIVRHFYGVLFTWHMISMATLIRGIGTYSSEGDIVRGTLKRFNGYDESTWDSAFLDKFTGNTDVLFGIIPADVDNIEMRAYEIPITEGAYQMGQRLFSRTRWVWRYGRYVEVVPLFFINIPTADISDGVGFDKLHDSPRTVHPFGYNEATYTAATWKSILDFYIKFEQRLHTFWFKNKSYAALKDKTKMGKFFDLPTWGVGTGGINLHQHGSFDEKSTAIDEIMQKGFHCANADLGSESFNNGFAHLQIRREGDSNYRFQVIGDVPLDDYLLVQGLNIYSTLGEGMKGADTPIEQICGIKGGFIIGVAKTEDDDYEMTPSSIEDMFASNPEEPIGPASTANKSPVAILKDYSHDGTYGYIEEGQKGDATSQNLTKATFYPERANDPYKKLAHKVYDINEMDVENLRAVMLEAFFNTSSSSAIVEEIPVSAKPDPKKKAADHKKKMKDQADKKAKAEKAETKVSARPEDSAMKLEGETKIQEVSAIPEEIEEEKEEKVVGA